MRIIEVKAEIFIDGEGNHKMGVIDGTKDFTEIEHTEDESTGTILSFTSKVKEHNDKEIKLCKSFLGKNSKGFVNFRLLIN